VKILHYLKWMRRRDGGVVNCVQQLAPLQSAHGHSVTLLTADASDVPRDAQWRHVGDASVDQAFTAGPATCVQVGLRDRVAELRGSDANKAERDTPFQLLTRDARETTAQLVRAADVVHIHGPWSSSNLQVAAIARQNRKPYVVSAHGMLDDWSMAQSALKKKVHLALFSRRMLNGAAWIHCTAQNEAAQVSKHTTARTRVVPLPMDIGPYRNLPGPEIARAKFGVSREKPTLLFLSRLHPKKGAEHAIDALAVLRKDYPTCELLIAGPAQDETYARMLKARVASLGLEQSVRFIGMVDGIEKISLYQACAALVLPTSQENFGFVILEALAAGTPVVTTRGVDLWQELETSGGATICEPDGAKIAQATSRLLASPVLREQMGSSGRNWVLKTIEPSGMVRAYEAMYAAV
jgi:glycosyltransferase involved in cell wall biosynthesis